LIHGATIGAPSAAGQRERLGPAGRRTVIYAELGFAAPLARGLFVLSRSVGIQAHAGEEMGQGRRNKGPIPRRSGRPVRAEV
jgi:hypothetical protein